MKNSWKRVAAGALSFAMVAGAMPANVGGLLTGGTGIVANAADEIVVKLDDTAIYGPTKIINGDFESSVDNYNKNGNYRGTGSGWGTTDVGFELSQSIGTYGLKNHTGIFAEMNYNNPATLYQDLETTSGDIMVWTLQHAARDIGGDQSIAVKIGASDGNYPSGIAANINEHILPDTMAVFTADGVKNPDGKKLGFASSNADLEALTVQTTGTQNEWKTARGVYIVPDGQTETRFAFVSTNPNLGGVGNMLDNITFATLLGNLDAYTDDEQNVIISGYWGDSDPNNKIVIEIGDEVKEINMQSVLRQNFKITVPASMVSDAKTVTIYHSGYPEAKKTIDCRKIVKFTPAEGLIYSENNQELMTNSAASATGLIIKYAITSTDVTEAPADDSELWQDNAYAVDAGTYRVWYKAVTEDASIYKPASGYSDVIIAKAAPTVTAPKAKESRYTGKAHELVEAGEVDGGTLVYSLDNGDDDESVASADNEFDNRNAAKRIQGESTKEYTKCRPSTESEMSNVNVRESDRGLLGWIENGAIAKYENVDFSRFGSISQIAISSSTSSANNQFSIWIDGSSAENGGTKIATINSVPTSGWGEYQEHTYDLDNTIEISGIHDVYVVTEGSGYNLDYFYFIGSQFSEKIPTATNIGEYKVWYKVLGDANHNDTEAAFVTASIGAGIANVTVPDDAVIEGQEATVGVYKLECGKTYIIYSDESLVPSTTAGLDIASQRNKTFNGKTYNYKYTVEFADTIIDGTEIAFAHKHAAKAFSTDATHTDLDKVWVYCEGEPSEQAGCVAYLDTNGTYYYGDSPTADDVKLSEYFGASAEVKDFYFTKKGDANGSKVSPENMKIGEKYVVNARIAVTIDSKVSNFIITREIEFAARPLTMCEVFLKNGEKETQLPIRDGAVTVPANTFTYNGEQQKPEIVIRNTVLGTETTLTSADYTDAVEAKTNAGRYSAELTAVEGANYSGSLTVNWSIAKAVADIQITPKEKIVYDGEALDKSDFVFEGKNADLLNAEATSVNVTGRDITNAGNTTANVKLTFENYKDINKDIPVTINKREVKVTPDADQSMIYGTEEAPVIKVETEKAVDNDEDGAWDTNTGVIPTDIEIDFAPAIDIADFDYAYFMNNAGTYSYKVSDTELKNYTALLEGTSVFTIKPKELTKDMFTVDEVDYTFNSKQKDAPMYVFSDGNYSDKKRTAKLTDNDFEIGGTDHAVLPGSYTLEFSGQGNYTGFVSYDWEIKPIRDYAAAVKIDSKTYDGKEAVPTSFVYKTDDDAKNPVKLPGTKTTYTYYEYDGESVIDEAYVKTLKALDGAPKDAGTYLVETTVTAKGYSLEKVYATFTINQKEIAVIPNSTSKVFGEADPDLADFTYDESAVAEGDTLTFTGEYALTDYSGNVGVYPFELGTVAVDNDNYKPTINGAYVVNAQELTDANIKIIKECTVTEDGWWYPGDCIKVIGTVDGKEIELVRPVYDEESKTYTNTDFEFISATKTKQNGEFSVQVKGIGNYTGYAEAIVLIHDEDYDQQAAIADGVAVDIADAALKDGIKARFLLTPTLAEDWTVEAYGIIYDKTGTVTDAETAKAGLVLGGKYMTKTCSAKDGTPYALNVTPENNKDVWAVGYITVRKGAMTTTIYTEPKYGNVTELQAKENVKIDLADAVLKDEIKARFVLTPEIAEGWTVKGYGIVYDKTGAVTDAETAKADLVLGGKYVTKTCSAKDGTAYALNITNVNDNKIWAVGYITVEKDGKTVTLYTEPKYAKVSELN